MAAQVSLKGGTTSGPASCELGLRDRQHIDIVWNVEPMCNVMRTEPMYKSDHRGVDYQKVQSTPPGGVQRFCLWVSLAQSLTCTHILHGMTGGMHACHSYSALVTGHTGVLNTVNTRLLSVHG